MITSPGSAADEIRKPNVLLVITDDQGWGDFSRHGNDQLATPVFDRLVTQGANCERFFVCPVCSPTRAGLLTGRYHLRGGVTNVTHLGEWLRPDEVTLAEVMQKAGYATACIGKWHNGAYYPANATGQGFREFLGFCGGHWNNYFDTVLERNGQPQPTTGYIADVLTDAAIDFVGRYRDQPFFCYLAYNTPHSPFQVPDEFYNRQRARGLDPTLASVYAMCENIDANLGRLLARVEQLGLRRDTIVVFLTDNGPNTDRYNGGMRGRKGSVHEGGTRVPLVIRWPGHIRSGVTVSPITSCVDVLPTLVELCGIEHTPAANKPLDGRSLVPLLTESKQPWPERTLFTWRNGEQPGEGSGAARTERWRWVREKGKETLFDMTADPQQNTDVAAGNTAIATDLRDQYDRWFSDASKDAFTRAKIPVGHIQAKRVELLAPDAQLSGNVRFHAGPGFANDWIVNWKSSSDEIVWDIQVVKAGKYRVSLKYTCPQRDTGATVRVTADKASVEGRVTTAFDPPLLPRPNRDEAKTTYDDKPWQTMTLGEIVLPAGPARLVLSAPQVAGSQVAEVKSVTVELQEP